MTEGEQFIEYFFKNQKIKYRKQQIIDGLENDSKNHRIADFYLPKYKVYVEYYGQWNNENEKERYREKRQVYIQNKIPCVILYPENLGLIEYIFPKRMAYVMSRYRLEDELRKYRWKILIDNKGSRLILIGIALLLLSISYPWNDKIWFSVFIATIVYQSALLFREYKKLFVKGELFDTYFD